MQFDKEKIDKAVSAGSEKAAEALYLMTGIKVEVEASDVKTVALDTVIENIDIPDKSLVAFADLNHSLNGKTIFTLTENNALSLADLLSGKTLGTSRLLQEIDRSAIKETLNIVSNSYIVSLGEALGYAEVELSPPSFATAETFLSDLKEHVGVRKGDVVVIKTILNIYKTDIEADLYFIIYT